MKKELLKKQIMTAMFTALICAATLVIQIPTPVTSGYVNVGDCFVLTAGLDFGIFALYSGHLRHQRTDGIGRGAPVAQTARQTADESGAADQCACGGADYGGRLLPLCVGNSRQSRDRGGDKRSVEPVAGGGRNRGRNAVDRGAEPTADCGTKSSRGVKANFRTRFV